MIFRYLVCVLLGLSFGIIAGVFIGAALSGFYEEKFNADRRLDELNGLVRSASGLTPTNTLRNSSSNNHKYNPDCSASHGVEVNEDQED